MGWGAVRTAIRRVGMKIPQAMGPSSINVIKRTVSTTGSKMKGIKAVVDYSISFRPEDETPSKYTVRSHTCGELGRDHVGTKVTLYGWLTYKRMAGRFLVLRDIYGTTQLIIPQEVSEIRNYLEDFYYYYCWVVHGKLQGVYDFYRMTC